MKHAVWLGIGCAVLLLMAAGCTCGDETFNPALLDGPGEDVDGANPGSDGGLSADGSGGQTDGSNSQTDGNSSQADGSSSQADGSSPQTDGVLPPDQSGWVTGDGGPLVVADSGVIITEDGGAQFACYPTTCADKLLECGDCVDNDGDGKTDWRDPECLGPCDNTEGPALIPGVGGVTGQTCMLDCYFDYGNGPGNDDCHWDHRCDSLEPEKATCPYDQTMLDTKSCPASQSAQCLSYCFPFTPNGCDCFGCCTFPALAGKGPAGGPGYVWIGAIDPVTKEGSCTFNDILDPVKCPSCTPVADCLNECGKCEVCIGKPVPPPECYQKPDAGVSPDGSVVSDGGVAADSGPATDAGQPSLQCPGGEQPCGLPGQQACAPPYYCISGCCIRVVIE